jgi:hypothetical protein
MKNIFISLVSIILISSFPCQANAGSAFAIFLSTNELSTNEDSDIEKLEFSNEPIITDSDIIRYIWKTHEIVLSAEGMNRFRSYMDAKPDTKQFLVVADGERCYIGAFWKSIYSTIYPNPVIIIDSPSQDRIKIERAYPSEKYARGQDNRKDKKIYIALKRVGKLVKPEETK